MKCKWNHTNLIEIGIDMNFQTNYIKLLVGGVITIFKRFQVSDLQP